MKILNTKLARQAIAAALVLSAAAAMSVGAFAAEGEADTAALTEDVTVAGYLPPQDESTMVQGDIALHSADVAVGEADPTYGGYASPVENPVQGNVMMIAETGDAQTSASAADSSTDTTPKAVYTARYTVKGLLGKQVLYTATQEGRVMTLSVPEDIATFRATVGEMRKLMANGINTVVLQTNNLSLLCEGQSDKTKITLRHFNSNAALTVGLRCRRDLIVGRDSNYGGYASPVENPIQGNVMMIAETGDAQTSNGR